KAGIDGLVQQHPLPGLDGALSLEVASVGELAAWLGQPLPAGQPDPGPLNMQVSLAADGAKLAIKSATINGKAAEATASGSFDGTGEIAKFDGKVHVAHLDLNAYLPPPSEEEAAPAGDKAQAPQGWSEEPIDFSPLRQAEGNLIITTGPVLYREIKVQKIAATVNLAGGVLKATLQDLQLTPGQVTGGAVVDASGKTVAISYQISLDGVESKPFLKSLADIDWLSGKLTFQTKGAAKGLNQKQIVSTLNGDGAFKFLDGAFEGIDLAGTLRKVGNLGMSQEGEKPKTDFTELSGSYTITNGLFQNQDLKMLAPLVRMNGAGQANLPPRTLDYRVEAQLVASMEGQGGQDALAGLPIPIHAHGPWDNLSYQVDWASVFQAAALDPSRIANMPTNLLDAAQNFGVALPIPGVGGEGGVAGAVGGALQGILGGGDKSSSGESSSPLQPLQNLLGGGKQTETQSTTQKGPQPTQQQQEQQQKQPSIVPDVGSILKKLF
ncbi:MAG: AsmA-like C-terminal region-containing protein, partial [Dehalococcoidia bacterium]